MPSPRTIGYNVRPVKWYCPNCTKLIVAYPDSSGKAKNRCKNCGTLMSKYRKSRQINLIEVIEPEDYVFPEDM